MGTMSLSVHCGNSIPVIFARDWVTLPWVRKWRHRSLV